MNQFRCVIFDMDGTVSNTHRLIFDAFNHILERYRGERWTDAQISALFGPPEEGALLAVVGKERLSTALTEYLEYYRSRHAELASVYDGIPEILTDLRQRGVLLGLFTGKGSQTTAITLEALGLSSVFHRVVTGNDVERHKPSGDGIRTILRELDVPPERAVMVGDAVADILAARDAGIPVASVLWDAHTRERVLAQARDFTFETVGEFGAWVRSSTSPNGSD